MPDQFTKRELAIELRNLLKKLDQVADEIIITYLDDESKTQEKSDLL